MFLTDELSIFPRRDAHSCHRRTGAAKVLARNQGDALPPSPFGSLYPLQLVFVFWHSVDVTASTRYSVEAYYLALYHSNGAMQWYDEIRNHFS